ncbi:MAG: tripartite tricarboxylate transporter TctB family protein [Dehalococcoidia bacterium]|nr:tripartite tricarboxylate transporter TctB family protein [Dehalococcoidia bacterium]
MNSWKTDIVTGTGVIIFAGFVLISSLSFPPPRDTDFGPALFPRVVAAILLILGILVLLQVRRHRMRAKSDTGETTEVELPTTSAGMRNVAVTLVTIVVYIAVVDRVGFIPTTLVFLFVLTKAYGLSTFRSVLSSCFITTFVYVLFSMLLRVVLP